MSERVKSIDVLRGITMAITLLVENPGAGKVYPQLTHALWNGFTVAYIVFPLFIFSAGMSIPFSVSSRLGKGESKLKVCIHTIYRSILLFCIGLLLNGFPNYDFSSIRIMGVFQRIAIVTLIASILVIFTKEWVSILSAVSILVIYILLIKLVYVPGVGKGIMDINGNLVQYVDMHILKNHMYTTNWDPEGLLSTLPAISTGLFGTIAGYILKNNKLSKLKKLPIISAAGLILYASGLMLNKYIPINKNLWSSSYVLYTAGIAFIMLAVLFIICDIIEYDSLFYVFKALGSSTIFVYFVSEMIKKTVWQIKVFEPSMGGNVYIKDWLCKFVISPWTSGANVSFYFSLTYILLWICVMSSFYRRKIYFKI